MRRIALLALLLAASAALGCDRAASVEGTLLGHPVEVREALFARQTLDGVDTTVVALVDREGVCDKFASDSLVADLSSLAFYIPWTTPGSYDASPSRKDVQILFTKTDGNCQPVRLQAPNGDSGRAVTAAREGRVTLDSVDFALDGRAKGDFDVTLGPQLDHLTGGFNARFCPALARSIRQPRCVQ